MRLYRTQRLVTALVALHSLALGVLSWFFTTHWFMLLQMPISGGYPFWPKQSGAFLISLGLGYGVGAVIPRYLTASTWVIILSKSVAILFLFPEFFLHGAPIAVLLAGLGDLSMLVLVGAIALCAYRYKDTALH
jgi:hypothetical protein